MNTADFFYDLPENLIAQTPMKTRDHSRLMIIDRETENIAHKHFYDIIDYLNSGDVLVINDSKVLPARLYGNNSDTGGTIEFLLLEQKENDLWEILVKPGKRAKIGAQFVFGNGLLRAEIMEIVEGGNRLAKFGWEGNFFDVLDQIGNMPLPPYITKKLEDKNRYQTVYADEIGSAAAPTAGLHFTQTLLENLKTKGVHIAKLTLHVGLGTFRPVKVTNIQEHHMHAEHYCLTEENAKIINTAKQNQKRVIAVGTTSCRTLESIAEKNNGNIVSASGYTDIFIYPGFEFKVLDGLITNLHLPESTLIMLVSAFLGYDKTMQAYNLAVKEKYRFFSFGDAMFIK